MAGDGNVCDPDHGNTGAATGTAIGVVQNLFAGRCVGKVMAGTG